MTTMDSTFRPLIAATLGAVLLAFQAGVHAQEYQAKSHVQRTPKADAAKLVQAKRLGPPSLAVRLLPAPPRELGVMAKDSKDTRATVVGFARPVRELADDTLASRLDWQDSGSGSRVAHFALTSPGAAALRVGIEAKAIPLGARLRFHDGSGRALEVRGEDILERIATNLEAGKDAAGARIFWSPVIESSTAVVEIELPAATRAADVRLGVPAVSHLVTSPGKAFALPKVESSCALDAKCQESAWGNEMNAEARILFTRDGTTYACSGTLLADQDPASEVPYFHTATHCIASQADASTAATYWFYRSSACNSGAPARFEVRNGGATLLMVHPQTDTTLLRLNEQPPAGAVYLGWSAGTPLNIGAAVTGIHHGSAEQKLSFGEIRAFGSCLMQGGMCMADSLAGGDFYYVTWRAGVTLPGGSGSPLIADSSRMLVGHLSSGMSQCGANSAGDFYGRFDVAYRAGLDRWLGAAPTPVATPAVPRPVVVQGPRLRLSTVLGGAGGQGVAK